MSRRYGSFQDGGAGFGGRNWNSTSQIPFESLELDESKDARTVFIGNLDCRVTRKMLYELMVQAGPVEAIRIVPPRDFNGGAPVKTISFVRYEKEARGQRPVRAPRAARRQIFPQQHHAQLLGSVQGRQPPDFPPRPTTFFELPRGLEDASDKLKQSLVGRKFINDLKDYKHRLLPAATGEELAGLRRRPERRRRRRGREAFQTSSKTVRQTIALPRRSRPHTHHHRQPQRTPRGDFLIRLTGEGASTQAVVTVGRPGDQANRRRAGGWGDRRSEEQRDRRSEGEEQRDRREKIEERPASLGSVNAKRVG
ncbi:hypothetical protein BV898_10980 [Hypsibius exemplaris]|uniref:RRM domain-containing protein n=1 Tax=Hypsibius exemplaris TaxID=2072580 RepID=A0A1W0WI02_HYPEX|nr:hypothetical protein BV898_10980 [Hypsibius exemplaris]